MSAAAQGVYETCGDKARRRDCLQRCKHARNCTECWITISYERAIGSLQIQRSKDHEHDAETAKHKTAGLAGVVAGQTAISTVGKEELGLTYRGYAIEDLAGEASFEEVAYLLIHGELPTRSQLDEYQRRLMGQRGLPDALRDILARLPAAAHPMDVLRTGCSALGCLEPEAKLSDGEQIADRLLAAFPSMLLDWYHASHFGQADRLAVRATEPRGPLPGIAARQAARASAIGRR